MSKVNLDAIIPREDFEVVNENPTHISRTTQTLRHEDLKKTAFFFSAIRKPDFQRETNEWDEEKIISLLESFLDGDLIPAIILWRNPSNITFVIDGAHRLSAIAAWLNDDYGDGEISKKFFDGIIPEDQIESAERLRQQIRRKIGSFKDFELAVTHPEKVRQDVLVRAKNLATIALQVQWVEGNAAKAESSFFKINRQAAQINPTEIRLLESRKKPNCIAARAIIRAGTGHKYWSRFNEENKNEIQKIAKEINEILFIPPLKSPIKTLDIPIGGRLLSAGSLQLILNLVNLSNNIQEANEKSLLPDKNGDATIEYLKNTLKICRKVNSDHLSSLGLHPIVYFYSKDGRHKPASFYGVIGMIATFEQNPNKQRNFISVRDKFENILLNYDYIVQQIGRKYRQADKSLFFIRNYFLRLIDLLSLGKSEEDVIGTLMKESEFSYITKEQSEFHFFRKDFSRETKSQAYIREAISTALRCKICNGYIHLNSISFDHIKRKSEGGMGKIDNAQLTHPFCNTGIKN